MSEAAPSIGTRVLDRLFATGHPLAVLVLLCIVVHLALIPLTTDFDIMSWTYVERNIRDGFGLYGVDGYYYTPVWGYVLGLCNLLQSTFVDIGLMAVRVEELLSLESCTALEMSANIASVAYNYSIKIPLMIVDIITGITVYLLVMETVGDRRKACAAFFFAAFCPFVLGAACITGMPDTISACMTMVAILLVRRDRYFLAGAAYSIAVLAKFFPIFLLPVLVAYVLRRRGGIREGLPSVVGAIAGFVLIAAAIFLPSIMGGNLSSAFAFITDRADVGEAASFLTVFTGYSRIVVYSLVVVASFAISVLYYRSDVDDIDNAALRSLFLVIMLCMAYPPLPQYLVVAVPLLAYFVATDDVRFKQAWIMLLVAAIVFVPVRNVALLAPLAVWTGLVPLTFIESAFGAISSTYVLGIDLVTLQMAIGLLIQSAGIALVFLGFYKSGGWGFLSPKKEM